ncbi:NADH-quinone oxidoreductase subunit F, partial [Mycobacterium tuberculosis]|nr:NADH-quinone oxidoreductase subunit F [Mycobacterium tuberculosis]
CTPCREGTFWLVQIMRRLEDGTARESDLDRLLDISDNIVGKSFCALGDAAGAPIMSSIALFRDEYLAHIPDGCPFDHSRSTVFART